MTRGATATDDRPAPVGVGSSRPRPEEHGEQVVSVVVCTRDRGAMVTNTLRSILASVGADLDVIVVDQSADDDTSESVASLLADSRLRYVRSGTIGVSTARNVGIGLARHPIVLITDDDVTVPDDWASTFGAALERVPKAAVAFCTVQAAPNDEGLGFVPDHTVDRDRVVRSVWSKSLARGIGAGMAVRRDAVLGFGGFDEQLGPGAPLHGAEDRDIAVRALARGWWVCQTSDTYVVHHGFRTWDEGHELTRRDWFGIGAAYGKHVRVGNVWIAPVILHEVMFFGLVQPVLARLIGRRRTGLKRLVYFGQGFVRGLRTPMDRSTMLYRPMETPAG